MVIRDLCSGAGLAADGYAAVLGGHALHGYDITPQPSYPYPFTQADVMLLLTDPDGPLADADALHALFGLPIWRHRLFLANFPLRRPAPTGPGVYGSRGCRHDCCPPDPITGRPRPWGIYHVPADSVPAGGRTALDAEHARQIMGAHRSLTWDEIKEGFPPAYTSWVAADLLTHLTRTEALR